MSRSVGNDHAAQVLSAIEALPVRADDRGIVGSWRRCLFDHKLDPVRDGPPVTLTQAELKDAIGPLDELIHRAMPEMDRLFRLVRHAGYCVNLMDRQGITVFSRAAPADLAEFRRRKLYTGSVFSEALEGTNGVGTCLAEGRALSVHLGEHFRRHWSSVSCSVAPVHDHAGRIVAALNISSCRVGGPRPLHDLPLAATVQAARRIEEAGFRAHFRSAWILAVADPQDIDDAWLAVDREGCVIGASQSARVRLGIDDRRLRVGLPLQSLLMFDDLRAGLRDGATLAVRWADGGAVGVARVSAPLAAPGAATVRPGRDPSAGRASNAPIEDGLVVADRDDADALAMEPATAGHRGPVDAGALLAFAGGDPALLATMRRVVRLIGRDLPILLAGETGTGKDHLARLIHASSERAGQRFVAVNCAALPEGLIDSELFGYQAGAFTGARRDGARGLIAQADKGTLFLDEIGDMPLPLQTRLLRVLENREVQALGGGRPQSVDVQVISASHQDLDHAVRTGRFRQDLYFRLCGVRIDLPPLRARQDKAAMIGRLLAEEGAPGNALTDEAMRALLEYDWPGNLRQLRHVLRRAAHVALHGAIGIDDLGLPPAAPTQPAAGGPVVTPAAAVHAQAHAGAHAAAHPAANAQAQPAAQAADATGSARALDDAQRRVVEAVLRSHAGSVEAAARALGLSRATLYRRLKRWRVADR